MNIKQEELDKIADVIWWIKGAMTVGGISDFDMSHVVAMGKLKDYHQDILNGREHRVCHREDDPHRDKRTVCIHKKGPDKCLYPHCIA